MDSISILAKKNPPAVIKEKAKEEASEYLVELCSNQDDNDLLNEAADVIITMFQVLEHKGILNKLPETIEVKSFQALHKYFPDYIT